ncbi:hypothetical protein LJC00_03510, partial [Dysgonomonas sp. OttesenSCG-928-M03]|nr:hypothetical protein [Dysgonomonas sp. OttesenSCG-928-M03]
QPEISLNYNSMAGVGPAGTGWSIGGISTIYLVNQNQYYNGFTSESWMNKDGSYMLDGMRLIKLSSETNHVNYESERGNILVKGHIHNNIIKYFEVLYPNGQKAIFGDIDNTVAELSYPIKKIEDVMGNYIEYNYIKDNNVYYIETINYGGQINFNSIRAPYASIKFIYNKYMSVPNLYTHGMKVRHSRGLGYIETYFNENKLRTYSFSYDIGTNLLELINCESDEESLNPIRFYYGDDSETGFSKISLTNTLPTEYNLKNLISHKAKFKNKSNNDGLIIYGNLPNYAKFYSPVARAYYYTTAYAREGSHPNDPIQILPDITEDKMHTHLTIDNGYLETLVSDIDGDGYDEIVRINSVVPNSSQKKEIITYSVYKVNNGTPELLRDIPINYYESVMHKTAFNNEPLYSPVSRHHLVGDFLGTGKNMIIRFSDNKNPIWDKETLLLSPKSRCSLISLDGAGRITEFNCFDINSYDYLFVIDYDGDGKDDIAHMHYIDYDMGGEIGVVRAYSLSVYSFNTFNEKNELYYLGGIGLTGNPESMLVGDINRDGKTDFITGPHIRSGRFGDEDGWWHIVHAANPEPWVWEWQRICDSDEGTCNSDKETKYYLQDVNKDGILDLLKIKKKKNISVHYGTYSGGFSSQESDMITLSEDIRLVPHNILHSNRISNLVAIQDRAVFSLSSKRDESRQRMITSIITSAGIKNEYKYASILDSKSDVYNSNSDYSYPYNNLSSNINLLHSSKASFNEDLLSSITFKYENGIIDKLGRGFLGFEKVISIDNIRRQTTTQTFSPKEFGVLKAVESPVLSAVYEPDIIVNQSNKLAKITLKKKNETDKLSGVTVNSSYEYDQYGNETKETVDYGNGIKTVTNTVPININIDGDYMLGLPEEKSIVNTRNGRSVTTKTVFDYNDRYQPVSKISYYNNNQTAEESFVYYQDGNLQYAKSKTYTSVDWVTTEYKYDSYGRLIQEINPLGLSKEYQYNGQGQLWKAINHKGHTITYEYDNWGRNNKTTYADGTIETNTLSWTDSPIGALFLSTVTASGQPDAQIYHDALGRKVREGSKRFDGQYLYTDYLYDQRGRLKKVSLPFKGGSPTLWDTYDYDDYDRITSLNYASGNRDAYLYDNLEVKSMIDGVLTTKILDGTGLPVTITDPAGSIKYSYRPDGQLDSIIAPGEIVTSFEYDKYGRQTHIKDPSAGTKTFAYDAAGNLAKDTDTRGKVINTVYDKHNRIKTKEIVGEFTTTYNYNTDGLLESETSTNNTSVEHIYDDLFRPQNIIENIADNKWLKKTLAYDTDGKIESTTYESQSGSIVTENYKYTYGHHTETLLNNNNSIWEVTAENTLGMPTTSQTGSLERSYSYDQYGMPTGRSIKHDDTMIQNVGYEFNQYTGNLKWRKDITRNLLEDFGYDLLNRLTNFNNKAMAYNNKGNVTSHSEIGSFAYNKDKPYAIEKVAPYGEHIPMRTQNITYNTLMRPETISENGYQASLSYTTNGDRMKMLLKKDDQDVLTRYYLGGQYEIDEKLAGNEERLYLDGDAYSAAAVYVKKGDKPWEVQYIGRDYLGSITHVISAEGKVEQELSYDPWGRLRNPENHTAYETDKEPELLLGNRGYTGHEHLSMFGLINMNARLYDPYVGRFLSPDPYVQAPSLSQSFNRYSYALNNPLAYTDPDGENPLIPFGVGMLFGYLSHGYHTGEWGWDAVGSGAFIGMGMGATYAATNSQNPWMYSGQFISNQIFANTDILSIGDFKLSINPIYMYTHGINAGLGSGWRYGIGTTASISLGNITINGGSNYLGGTKYSLHGGISFDDGIRGVSYMGNMYNYKDKQVTGTLGLRFGEFSVKHENDLFGRFMNAGKQDRFRTAALEMSYKFITAGFSTYTT